MFSEGFKWAHPAEEYYDKLTVEGHSLPRGSYSTPFFGHMVLCLGSYIYIYASKVGNPKKGRV